MISIPLARLRPALLRVLVALLLATGVAARSNGSTTTARCPVTGALLQLGGGGAAFAVVEFIGGQRLYLKDEQAAAAYR